MVIPKEREKREGLIGTLVFHAILLLFFLYYGLTYTVPIPEVGLTVNFGTSDMGSGEVQPEVSGQQSQPDPTPEQEVTPTPPTTSSETAPDVVTQDNTEAIAVPKSKTPEEIAAEKEAEEKARKEREQEEFRKKMAQTSNAFNNSNAQSGGSEGNDNQPGDKGQTDGSKNGGSYVGGGTGDGNYSLAGRAALEKPKPKVDCAEVGIVVVDVRVDRDGNVVSAQIGKGTNNSAECLTSKALDAARKTKWQPKVDAPPTQGGKITYDFRVK